MNYEYDFEIVPMSEEHMEMITMGLMGLDRISEEIKNF